MKFCLCEVSALMKFCLCEVCFDGWVRWREEWGSDGRAGAEKGAFVCR